ncbi:MAG: MFS transporter [Planctomycetota bacterium]
MPDTAEQTAQPEDSNPFESPLAPSSAHVEGESPQAPSSTRVEGDLPPLMRDRSFWGMSVTQFLGAFNDNLFKQLLLLLATPTAAQMLAAEQQGGSAPDRQAEAMIVFAVAFLLFSGLAGWLADRTSKRTLIIWAKAAEIVVMVLGSVGFYFYGVIGLPGMLVILFLMGLQSTFFGPAKYGILPETIRDKDLPVGNGIFLMFTFVAIIFGTVMAGAAKQISEAGGAVWLVSVLCILVAVAGTGASLLVRKTPAAKPGSPLRWRDFLVPPEAIDLVRRDRQLLLALVVTSSFWLLGSIVQQSVNALGKTQLGLGDGPTSVLAAMLGVGIPIGCLIGGKLSRGCINPRVVVGGAAGIVACLVLLSLRGGEDRHLLGFAGSVPVLVLTGVSTGIFIVPIQVAVQALPPPSEKGRMIALMNQCNWVGIIIGALLYKATVSFAEAANQPRNIAFAVGAAVMLPIALFYRPKEMRLGE